MITEYYLFMYIYHRMYFVSNERYTYCTLLLGMKSIQFHFVFIIAIIFFAFIIDNVTAKQQFFIVFICVEVSSSERSIRVTFECGDMRRQTSTDARQVSVTYVEIRPWLVQVGGRDVGH